MNETIRSLLASTVLRTLQVEPGLTPSEAVIRIENLLPTMSFPPDSAAIHQDLQRTAGQARRRGVLNPLWLSQAKRIDLNYYLVRTQPGWLRILEEQTRASAQISYYVLYGDWDALISLHGIQEESATLLERITATTPYDWVDFLASRVLFFHRYRTNVPSVLELSDLEGSSGPISPNLVNEIVDNYDNPALEGQRRLLEDAGILLGSTWELGTPPTDVRAYTSISLRGPIHNLESDLLLEDLLQDELLRTCMVHLVELDRAKPFNYLAKLVCQDFEELDRATDAIGSRRIGAVTLETRTFVVARGNERLPLVTGQRSPTIVAPDTRGIESLAQETLEQLGSEAIVAFNDLDPRLQPRVLDTIRELQEQVRDRHWEDNIDERITAALTMFSRAVLEGASPGTLHGPVINIAQVVEGIFKETLEKIIRRVYGRDFGQAQKDLRLRNRRVSELSLGNILNALRTIKTHNEFAFMEDALDDEWLDRLEHFSDIRNRWAHAGRSGESPYAEIDNARRAFSEAVRLIRWLFMEVRPYVDATQALPNQRRGQQDVVLSASAPGRRFGVFLSHSTKDGDVADRIATGLRALMRQYPVWYSDWAIKAGESIVEKINEGLTQNDALVVLLSKESVASPWVRRELTATVMDQLAGQDVTVVPILIEECSIPLVLRDIRYIDMRPDRFEKGFIELFEFLTDRQRRRS